MHFKLTQKPPEIETKKTPITELSSMNILETMKRKLLKNKNLTPLHKLYMYEKANQLSSTPLEKKILISAIDTFFSNYPSRSLEDYLKTLPQAYKEEILSKDTFLDLSANNGKAIKELEKRGKRAWGITLSIPQFIWDKKEEVYKRTFPSSNLIVGDSFFILKNLKETFEVIFDIFGIVHYYEHKLETIKLILKNLSKNGIALIKTQLKQQEKIKLQISFHPHIKFIEYMISDEKFYTILLKKPKNH